MMFDAPRPLASNAATDPPTNVIDDVFPAVAGDGLGNWVTVWSSSDPAVGVTPGTFGEDAVFSRSTDDGRTWSPLAILNSDAATQDAQGQAIATNGQGTWIAGLHGDVDEVEVVRSTDAGATWSDPLRIDGLTSNALDLRIVADTNGYWMAMWLVNPTPTSTQWGLELSHSNDDGVTWSTASFLYVGDTVLGFDARLATDHAGRWIATWCDGFDRIKMSVSSDAGATWSSAIQLGGSNQGDASRPDLATDGAGTWIVVWDTTSAIPGADQSNFDYDIAAARSSDNGNTWSAGTAIGGVPALTTFGQRQAPRVRYDGGVWQVVWTQAFDSLGGTIGQEGDLVGVRSFDAGLSWTDPAAINVNASRDNSPPTGGFPWRNLDFLPDLETAQNGTSILVWTSTNSLNDTIGSDYDVFFARSHNDCPTVPLVGCRVPTAAQDSSLDLNNPPGGHDKLSWKWRSSAGTIPSDFGDPTTSSNYVLCLYSSVEGTIRNVSEIDAAAGSQCAGGSCWQHAGSGFRYRDPDERNGPMKKLVLSATQGGEAAIGVSAAGAALAPPVMPFALDPSVIAQLINIENNQCWEAQFSAADINESDRFSGRSD
ncbi:MAG TPA: sialidase family protein [Candidatus Binatia bacterium]|jgi:hypothetical protein